eukprot:Colp12_sorted_trinity150504_noHs@29132
MADSAPSTANHTFIDGYDCDLVEDPTAVGLAAGVIIALGVMGSYIPQHINIIRRQSSAGISPLFLFVGNLSAFFVIANATVLQNDTFICCPHWGSRICFDNALKLLQLGLQWISLGVVFLLFMIFFPGKRILEKEWRVSKILCAAYIIFMLMCIIFQGIATSISSAQSDFMQWYARVLGVLGTVLTLVQYIPQIYTTFVRKSAGAFSIPMLFIQFPGTLVWTYLLASGHNADVTTWLPNFTAACFQGLLLSLCLYFACRARRFHGATEVAKPEEYKRLINDAESSSEDEFVPELRHKTSKTSLIETISVAAHNVPSLDYDAEAENAARIEAIHFLTNQLESQVIHHHRRLNRSTGNSPLSTPPRTPKGRRTPSAPGSPVLPLTPRRSQVTAKEQNKGD